MMTDEDTSDLAKIGDGSIDDYMETLAKYISGSSYETTAMTNSDFEPAAEYYNGNAFSIASSNNVSLIGGATSYYRFNFSDNIVLLLASRGGRELIKEFAAKGSFKGEYTTMYVDINGVQTKPNVVGRDIFGFYIDSSGKILPMGSKTFAWMKIGGLVSVGQAILSNSWEDNSGTYACNETVVTKGSGCAGSIFDNNLKVIYQ